MKRRPNARAGGAAGSAAAAAAKRRPTGRKAERLSILAGVDGVEHVVVGEVGEAVDRVGRDVCRDEGRTTQRRLDVTSDWWQIRCPSFIRGSPPHGMRVGSSLLAVRLASQATESLADA